MADPTDREQPDPRIEAAAKAIGCYSDVQWQRWQHTSKGQQAHDRAVVALAAADSVDPLRTAGRDRAIQAASEKQALFDAAEGVDELAFNTNGPGDYPDSFTGLSEAAEWLRARAESLETS